MTHGKWTFCIIELWLICLKFGQFVSMKVKTLCLNNSNLVTSTHFKVENTLLLVDVCHSKMLLLKVPNDRPLPAYRAIFCAVFDSRSSFFAH